MNRTQDKERLEKNIKKSKKIESVRFYNIL